ncbi:fumarylacetoacetate hydrolase family protein [Rhodococcus opacus]|nr:fumarylacetoacetate hydrolase family protein [Rhodococcus opacus]
MENLATDVPASLCYQILQTSDCSKFLGLASRHGEPSPGHTNENGDRMRFVTCKTSEHGDLVGVIESDGIFTLSPGISLISLLGDDGSRLRESGEQALANPFLVLETLETVLRSPIPEPRSIRDFVTFESHTEGTVKLAGIGSKPDDMWYQIPTFYFSNPHAVVGPRDDVPMPPGCELFDLELEVAAVIGRAGHNLSVAEAEDHVVGFTIMNDWSARDIQFQEMRIGLGPAKGKDTAITLGPSLVTKDELEPYRSGDSYSLTMEARINGEVLGTDVLSNMAWTFPELVAYASRGTAVVPGDVLGSGTCGMGCLAELWGRQGYDAHPSLQIDDVVTLTVSGLGEVSNRVVAGAHFLPLR